MFMVLSNMLDKLTHINTIAEMEQEGIAPRLVSTSQVLQQVLLPSFYAEDMAGLNSLYDEAIEALGPRIDKFFGENDQLEGYEKFELTKLLAQITVYSRYLFTSTVIHNPEWFDLAYLPEEVDLEKISPLISNMSRNESSLSSLVEALINYE